MPPLSRPVNPDATIGRLWQRRSSALARRINLATWLALAAPTGFFVATAFAIAFYALRRSATPLGAAWLTLLGALVVAAVVCWWRVRRAFFSSAEARVFLEAQLRLDNRLTAATEGLVPWPEMPAALPAVTQWQLRAPAGWFVASVAMLGLAVLAPIPAESAAGHASGPPPALLQTEAMLSALKEMKVADPQAIEQLQERAQELARRPAEEQYSHSALEAADALHNQTTVAAAALSRGLDAASNAMRSADNNVDMKSAAAHLSAALSGLREGAMPANKDLLSALSNAASQLGNMTQEQRDQLAKQLADAAQKSGNMAGVGGAQGANAPVAQPDPNSPLSRQGRGRGQGRGQGQGDGDGDGGDGTGPGGPGGGGGTAPLALSSDQSDAGDGSMQGLSPGDMKHFSLGDKLGTTASAHDSNPDKAAGPTSAGGVAAPASGGEAVWVNRLTPAERAAVKQFFK